MSKVEDPVLAVPPDGFTYVPGFLTIEEHRTLLLQLQGLDYVHEIVRGKPLKRGRVEFGIGYVTTGKKLKPASPFPQFLNALIQKGLPHCPDGTQFNSCLAWRYPEGAGIGWHADAPLFGDRIMVVSLDASARLQFRPVGSEHVSYEECVSPGSIYIMSGPCRRDYQHQIVPVKEVRYSITFRFVAEMVGNCEITPHFPFF